MTASHPTINAWMRDLADGAYRSQPPRWSLRVYWRPPKRTDHRGSFHWEARRNDGPLQRSEDAFMELELAMAAAEEHVRISERREAHALAQRLEQAIDSSK